jgi:hypothetical protein
LFTKYFFKYYSDLDLHIEGTVFDEIEVLRFTFENCRAISEVGRKCRVEGILIGISKEK